MMIQPIKIVKNLICQKMNIINTVAAQATLFFASLAKARGSALARGAKNSVAVRQQKRKEGALF